MKLMHIQKLSAMFCVAALVGASAPSLLAADPATDAKLREALRQEMARLNGQTNAPSTAAPASTPAPAPAPAPEVVAPQAEPATTSTPAPVMNRVTPYQEQQLREALHKAMANLNAQPNGNAAQPAPQPVVQPVQPVTEPVTQPVVAAPAPTLAPQPAPETTAPAVVETAPAGPKPFNRLSPDEQQKLLEAERAELTRLNAAEQAAAPAKEHMTPKPAVAKVTPAQPTPMPAPAPAVMAPAPASKEQRLNDLLQLYKADKITPYEYHQERAKILAE